MPVLDAAVPGRRQVLAGLAAAGIAAGTGGLLDACGGPAAARPASPQPGKRYGGTLRAGLTGGSSSDTLDPHEGLNYLDTARAQALYEPLVQLDPDAGITYVLASEMTRATRPPRSGSSGCGQASTSTTASPSPRAM
jgi:peptide/nickel transport system substrate-binding protein